MTYTPPRWAGRIPYEYAKGKGGNGRTERAWNLGLIAGKEGKSERDNPYSFASHYNFAASQRHAWEDGRQHGTMLGPDTALAPASKP